MAGCSESKVELRGCGVHLRGGGSGETLLFSPSLPKLMHRINLPTHVIWGNQDKIIPPDHAEEFKRLIASASVTMIDQCGHLPQVEKAGKFTEAVNGFIAGRAA